MEVKSKKDTEAETDVYEKHVYKYNRAHSTWAVTRLPTYLDIRALGDRVS